MPRNYKPKGKNYSEQVLKTALKEMEEGLSLNKAAVKYQLNKALLSRKSRGLHTGKGGKQNAFSDEEEQKLATCIKTMARWGFCLTKQELLDIAQDYVESNNLKTPFKHRRPGTDWFISFRKRHNLSIRKLENLEKVREKATSNPFIIYGFYDLLEEVMKNLEIQDRPECIWNLDETCFSSDPSKTKGLVEKGSKAKRITEGTGRENTTVLGCVSASGNALPPLIIFQAANLWSTWKGKNDLPGTFYAVSENGWMTSAIFSDWFQEFRATVEERPLLLIFDGHLTHLDYRVIEQARSDNITILKLPAHTTSELQVLDKTCFGPLKTHWDRKLMEWQRLHRHKLSKTDFASLLCEIWNKGLSKKNIQAGFQCCGIFPLDRSCYNQSLFKPDLIDRYNSQKNDEQEPNEKDQPRPTTSATESDSTEIISGMEKSTPEINAGPESIAGPSRPDTSRPPDRPTSRPPSRASSQTSFEELILERLSPQTKENTPIPKKRRKIEMQAEVITSEKYQGKILQKLNEEKEREKKKKEAKERRIKKKQERAKLSGKKNRPKPKSKHSTKNKKDTFLASESSSDNESPIYDDSDSRDCDFEKSSGDDVESYCTTQDPKSVRQCMAEMKKSQASIKANQFYAVYFEEKYWYGQVLKTFENDEDTAVVQVEMKFLSKVTGNEYWWPLTARIEIVNASQVFRGPITVESFNPFVINDDEHVQKFYSFLRNKRDVIFAS